MRVLCRASAVLTLCVLVTAPERARAQVDDDGPPPAVNKEGAYSGVKPGDTPFKKPQRRNVVSWIGFQPRADGSARVFVQLSNELPYQIEVQGDAVLVRIEGASYRNRNARRRLDTRFFESSIRQVTSRRVSARRARGDQPALRAGVEVRIDFKTATEAHEPTATLRAEKDGYHYLYLDFRPGAGAGSITMSDPG